MKKKGFTLIELLGVIVLLGVVLGIAIVSYTSYLSRSEKTAFSIEEESLVSAARAAYADCLSNDPNNDFCNYHTSLSEKYNYDIIYLNELIEDNYIDTIKNPYDTEQTCNVGKSYVYISRKNASNGNNAEYEYKGCLVCGDYKSEDCLTDEELAAPSFETICNAYYDSIGGEKYDGSWTTRSVHLEFIAAGSYRYGIDEYRYTVDGVTTSIDANSNDIATLAVDKNVNNKEYTVKGYDGMNGVGTEASCGQVKIDRSTPAAPTITASDGIATGNWHNANTTLSLSGSSAPSGITYYIDTNSNPTTARNSITITQNTSTTTYYAKACNGAGTCSSVSRYELKLDKTAPTVPVLTGGSSSWVTSTRTIRVSTASTALSGIKNYEYYSSTSSTTPSTTATATGTTSSSTTISTQGERYIYFRAVSNSGLKSSWSSYQISRYDSVSPSVTTSRSGKTTTMTLTDNVGVVKYGVSTSSTTAPYYTTITSTTSTSRTYTASTWGTYYVWVQDNSGNTTVKSFSVPSSAFNYTATLVSSSYTATLKTSSYSATKSTYAATRTCEEKFVRYEKCCPHASGCPDSISIADAYGTSCNCNCNQAWKVCYPNSTCTVTENVCSYSCSSGGSLSGTTCTSYSCTSSSHSLSGSTCSYSYYSCTSSSHTLSGSTCRYSYYTCPNGGSLSGTTCRF